MGKEISEKTFELNITAELLNPQLFANWYGKHERKLPMAFRRLMRQAIVAPPIFGEGLTQAQEAKLGFDVAFHAMGIDQRFLFLQYKAGTARKYSTKQKSIFQAKHADPAHIHFTINDDKYKNQHLLLRKLAKERGIKPSSVMYVFPRIVEKSELYESLGNLLDKTSFVPILDIDAQAAAKQPKVAIRRGRSHVFRISYDGQRSELNPVFMEFQLEQDLPYKILEELRCIQFERAAKILVSAEFEIESILSMLEDLEGEFDSPGVKAQSLEHYRAKHVLGDSFWQYTQQLKAAIAAHGTILASPEKYTSSIPERWEISSEELETDYADIQFLAF